MKSNRCEVCAGQGTIHDARFAPLRCPDCGGTGERRPKRRVPTMVKAVLLFAVFGLSPVWIDSSRVWADVQPPGNVQPGCNPV